MRMLRVPKVQLFLTLVLIFSTSFLQSPQLSRLTVFAAAIIATVFFDLLFTYIRKRKIFLPEAAFATGAIIGLIISPSSTLLEIAVASSIAMFLKNYLRVSNRHIFNPAASGLLIYGLIFSQAVAWWGPSLQNWMTTIALLSTLLVSAWRMKRWPAILVFLATYQLWLVIRTQSLATLNLSLFDPTILFFAFVMLPEPMTSPVKIPRQIMYGVFIALAANLLTLPIFSSVVFPDILIVGLLIGNLVFFKFR